MEAVHLPRYINQYTDFGFKKLFGEEGNKDLLIDFLNQLLPERHQIASLIFKNGEALPEAPFQRRAFFDIHCTATSGERFIVEMQKSEVQHFKDRALFYITFPIREQSVVGKKWTFKLEPVYFIAILDFLYDEKEELAKFRRDISLKDQDCEAFYDKLHFKFLHMPAFKKQEHELETHFDKWCYFLKNLESFDEIPQMLNEPIFEKAFHTAEMANLTRAQRDAYEQSVMDYIGVREVGVTAAEDKERELVIAMHLDGLELERIARISKLPLSRVKEIIDAFLESGGS